MKVEVGWAIQRIKDLTGDEGQDSTEGQNHTRGMIVLRMYEIPFNTL